MDPEDEVIELAFVELAASDGSELSRWRTFLMPKTYIKPDARAAHHIRDEELENAPYLSELIATGSLPVLGDEDVIPVAHNMEFDSRMLKQSGYSLGDRLLCTYKIARHLYPDAPKHSNQVLRYWLGLEIDEVPGPPHRALPDAIVTAALFRHMLTECTLERMFQLMDEPLLLPTCNMGDKRGLPWKEQDVGLLRWVLDPRKTFDEDTLHTARYWLNQPRDRSGRLIEVPKVNGAAPDDPLPF